MPHHHHPTRKSKSKSKSTPNSNSQGPGRGREESISKSKPPNPSASASASASASSPSPIPSKLPRGTRTLDGSTLEGGGQLLRNALSLSSLTLCPIFIHSVRANRPGAVRGLKRSHLATVMALARLASADVFGAAVGSQEVLFVPGAGGTDGNGNGEEVWKELESEEGFLVELETMGSVWLVWQALMPVLLFRPSSCSSLSPPPLNSLRLDSPENENGDGNGDGIAEQKRQRLRLKLKGGTFASFAPTTFYVKHVLLPTLKRTVGIPGVLDMKVTREGFSTGPRMRHGDDDRGEVTLDIEPFLLGEGIKAFGLNRGRIMKLGICIAAHEGIVGAIEAEARRALGEEIAKGRFGDWRETDAGIKVEVRETILTSSPSHLSLLLLAETDTGCILARDDLWEKKVKQPLSTNSIGELAQMITRGVVGDLLTEIGSGACVDEHMADQLVVFQALSNGQGKVETGMDGISLHTRTARWVAETMLGDIGRVRFEEEDDDDRDRVGSYEGCGYRGLREWRQSERERQGETGTGAGKIDGDHDHDEEKDDDADANDDTDGDGDEGTRQVDSKEGDGEEMPRQDSESENGDEKEDEEERSLESRLKWLPVSIS